MEARAVREGTGRPVKRTMTQGKCDSVKVRHGQSQDILKIKCRADGLDEERRGNKDILKCLISTDQREYHIPYWGRGGEEQVF